MTAGGTDVESAAKGLVVNMSTGWIKAHAPDRGCVPRFTRPFPRM